MVEEVKRQARKNETKKELSRGLMDWMHKESTPHGNHAKMSEGGVTT